MEDVREALKGAIGAPTKEQLAIAAGNFEAELPEVKKRMTVPLSRLKPSPTNPRKRFDGIEALAETFKSMGIISALVVRPIPETDKFEIIAGERRWRAAKVAKLDEVPIEIRYLTDSQVSEVQLVENGQRKDLEPMEEAIGFARLRDEHHYSVAQIASKIGKSKGHVHARLKLMALCPEARKALEDGKIDATVAVPLARQPHKQQAIALRTIVPPKGYERMSSRDAIEFLTRDFSQTLKGSPFDQKDPDLLPVQMKDGQQIGGSCVKCPNRSGSTPGLFDDISGHDTCTVPACFQMKADLAWRIASAAAKEKGQTVLPIAKAKGIFDRRNELAWNSDFVLANAPAAEDPKKRSWKQLAGKLEGVETFFIPDQHLKGRECYRKDDLLKLIAKEQKWAKTALKEEAAAAGRASGPAQWEKERQKREAREVVIRMVVEKAAAPVTELQLPHLRLMALVTHHERRGFGLEPRGLTDATAEAWITEKATGAELASFVYEAALVSYVGSGWNEYSEEALALAKKVGIDVKEQEKFAKQKLEEEEKAKAAETAKAKEQPGSDDAEEEEAA